MTRFNHFEFYNPNPKENITEDCVIRALTKVLNKTWFEVYDEACAIGREICHMPNNEKTWKEVLKRHGFVRKTVAQVKRGGKALTPEKFCELHPQGVYILRMAHHLQACVDGRYYDLTPGLGAGKVYSYYEKVNN